MAFITVTWDTTDAAIAINVRHIIAVYPDSGMTVITTTNTSSQYWVKEDYSTVMKRIETAQVYGPK